MRVNFTFSIDDAEEEGGGGEEGEKKKEEDRGVDFDLSFDEVNKDEVLTEEMGNDIGVVLFMMKKTELIPPPVYDKVAQALLDYIEERPQSEEGILEILHTLNNCEHIKQAIEDVPIVKPSDVFGGS